MSNPLQDARAQRPWYRRPVWIVLGSLGAVLLLCCAGLTVIGLLVPKPPAQAPGSRVAVSRPATASKIAPTAGPTSTAPAASSRTPTAPTAGSADHPGVVMCKVTAGGDTYYLMVSSEDARRFTACAGAEIIEDLLTRPGVTPLCVLGLDYVSREQAVVQVYADAAPRNLAAAKAFCAANGGVESTG